MANDPKFGYAQIGNKKFTLSGGCGLSVLCASGAEDAKGLCAKVYRERRERDREYFFSRFDFFWDMRAEIASRREIYDIYPLFSGLSLAYAGGGPLSLGALTALWDAGLWSEPCPRCGGTARVYFAGGSPLSGSNSYDAQCPDCGEKIHASAQKFYELWRPAKKLLDVQQGIKVVQPQKKEQPRREDFRSLSLRWKKEYDEKSGEELAQAALERRRREEEQRRCELEAELERYRRLNLTPDALPSQVAEAALIVA